MSVDQARIAKPASARADADGKALVQNLLDFKASPVLPVYEARSCMAVLVRIAFHADIDLHFLNTNICSYYHYITDSALVNAGIFGYTQDMKKIVFILAALLLFTACACNPTAPENEKKLDIYAFSIGKADAILVRTENTAVMIDAGENGDGEKLVSRLQSLGVAKLDLLILTHFDKDHIGGADAILRSIPVDRIVLPSYEKESKQYTELIAELNGSFAEITKLTQDLNLQYDGMDIFVWPSPVAFDGKSDNEQSLITKVLYDGKTCLFMGDAEKQELRKLVYGSRNLTCDVLKLPHHGVYDENTFALLTVAMPSYVVICDSVKNPADEETLRAMDLYEPKILQTKNGEVHLIISGGVIKSE